MEIWSIVIGALALVLAFIDFCRTSKSKKEIKQIKKELAIIYSNSNVSAGIVMQGGEGNLVMGNTCIGYGKDTSK